MGGQMRKAILAAACAAMLGASAQAQGNTTCGETAGAWPLMETLKGHFNRGDYRAFLEDTGPMLSHKVANYPALFGAMDELFPDGFHDCQTVLVRDEKPAFRQELIMFTRDDMRGPITLLLIAAKLQDEAQLVYFTYNSAVTEVLGKLQ